MKNLKFIISLLLVLGSAVLCQQIILRSTANQKLKDNIAELNHVKYGIFSMDTWKSKLSTIVKAEIKQVDLSENAGPEFKEHIEVQLGILIDKISERIRKANDTSTTGWFTQTFIDSFIDMKDIKAGIPEYADAIIAEMTKKKNEKKLKKIVNQQVNEYFEKTYDTDSKEEIDRIIEESLSPDIIAARKKIEKEIIRNQEQIVTLTALLVLLSILLFAMSGFRKSPLLPSEYHFMLASLAILLISGVTIPMIDLEAKIARMSFMLMNHPIVFENQLLFFQSKSVIDVFWVMITHSDIQMKFVGILMIAFSIFFPFIKMVSSMFYYFNYFQARSIPLVRWFVLKSGKWSMADVMVVAIFMSYIGFTGIITSQLDKMSKAVPEVNLLTTNGTSLQPGYYLFLTYSLLALFLSGYLAREKSET